jgi:hypothetical protein
MITTKKKIAELSKDVSPTDALLSKVVAVLEKMSNKQTIVINPPKKSMRFRVQRDSKGLIETVTGEEI